MSEDEASEFRFVCVGHHSPPTNLIGAFELPWLHGIVNGVVVADRALYPKEWLSTWRESCSDVNVHRSLKVFNSQTDIVESLLGPLLIDIDGSFDSIEDALDVARRTCDVLLGKWKLSGQDFRVFFSGQKGFHIEIKPSAAGVRGGIQEQLILSEQRVDSLLASLQGGIPPTSHNHANARETVVIDRVYGNHLMPELRHAYIRLNGSFNLVVYGSCSIRRRKIAVSLDQVYGDDISKILETSQS